MMGRYLDLIETPEPSKPEPTRYAKKAKNAINRISAFNAFSAYRVSPGEQLDHVFAALERRCPDHVEVGRWQRAVEDGRRFLAQWGEQAAALGWTARDLFGLHTPPADPHPTYDRLSRYDATGLLWLLEGRTVTALSSDTAVIRTATGANLKYRKDRKPAYGPIGDSLDDFVA